MAKDDKDALEIARTLLSYIPQNWKERAPRLPCDDPIDRREESLLDILPDDRRFTYDMHEVIEKIIDKDSFFEVKDEFAPNIITGFCRLDGHPVGLIANNPR